MKFLHSFNPGRTRQRPVLASEILPWEQNEAGSSVRSTIASGSSGLSEGALPDCSSLAPQDPYDLHLDYGGDYCYENTPIQQPCNGPDANVRGAYSTNLAPCVFQFHKAEDDDSEKLATFEQTTVCSSDYLVGNEGNEGTKSNTLYDTCAVSKWVFPECTTHISVNCTQDKDHADGNNTNVFEAYEKHMKHFKVGIAAMFLTTLSFCFLFCCVSYRWVIKTHQETMIEYLRVSQNERDAMLGKAHAV